MEDKFRDKNIDGIAGEPVNFANKKNFTNGSVSANLLNHKLLSYSMLAIALCLLFFVFKSILSKETPQSPKNINVRIEALEKKVKELEQKNDKLREVVEKNNSGKH